MIDGEFIRSHNIPAVSRSVVRSFVTIQLGEADLHLNQFVS